MAAFDFPSSYQSLISGFSGTKKYINGVDGSNSNSGDTIYAAYATIDYAISANPTATPTMFVIAEGTYTVTTFGTNSTAIRDGGNHREFVCQPGSVVIQWTATAADRDAAMLQFTNANSKIYGGILRRNNNGRTTNYTVAYFKGQTLGNLYNCVFSETNTNGAWSYQYDNYGTNNIAIHNCTFYNILAPSGNYTNAGTCLTIDSVFNTGVTTGGTETNVLKSQTVNASTYQTTGVTTAGVYSGTYAWGQSDSAPLPDSLFSPAGTTRLLGLEFNGGVITKTGAYTVTQTGSLTFPTSGGVLDTGYATGWTGSAYLRVDQLVTASTNANKTYCAWYKGTQTAAGGSYSPSVPVFAEVTGSVWYGLGISAGKITVANATLNNGTTLVNTGEWVFLAWVVKSNYQVDAYVNGVKELSNIGVSASYPGTSYIGAGYNYAGVESPTALDSIQIFDGELAGYQILEIYTATMPSTAATPVIASGGTVTQIDGYVVHTFTSGDIFTVSQGGTVEYLVVAGGGGGGSEFGGAGGAGGLRTGTITITAGTYPVVVGAGGGASTSGSNSSALDVSTTGGGAGGTTNVAGSSGGSGGSAGIYSGNSGSLAGAAGTAGQGNAAGASYNGFGDRSTGGGGGSGGVGGDALINHRGGNGGAGTASSISGVSVTYAGGGGGFAYWTNTDYTGVAGYVGSGAAGGGNGGSVEPTLAATSASVNSGSGGGGAGGGGGSGIVIVRYAGTIAETQVQVASGGTVTEATVDGRLRRIHTFNSSGNFVLTENLLVEYLVIAGGGGAAGSFGGGGGAGGYRSSVPGELSGANSAAESRLQLSSGTYAVIVGGGGAGGNGGLADPRGTNGSNSSFSSITSLGGGTSGSYRNFTTYSLGVAGGSGGGGGSAEGATRYAGGAGTASQGFAGGQGWGSNGYIAGGGGGAGAVGQDSIANSKAGDGGTGISSSINGTPTFRAGGGGGAAYNYQNSTIDGTGGNGGGGAGRSNIASATGISGTTNTGGGGGGGGYISGVGGAGGSGVVIISYDLPVVWASGTGGVVTEQIVNRETFRIHTFTSGGNFVATKPGYIAYLLVGGGGGGGSYCSGGGGGGGLLTGLTSVTSSTTYPIVIGAGGVGANINTAKGAEGIGTTALGLTAVGGGGGASYSSAAAGVGGSGGGGSGLVPTGAAGTTGQGFAGGNGNSSAPNYGGGGGGGAGGVGANGTSTSGGNGGVGASSSITGTATFYAGGGGGSTYQGGTVGLGGSGGGGLGGVSATTTNGSAGGTNTGGGGGGASFQSGYATGGTGGSGIAVIRYSIGLVPGVGFAVANDIVTAANEGSTVTVTFTGVEATGSINYTITGVSTADIGGASLTGTVNLVDYTATITLVLTEDSTIGEGAETMTVSFVENSITYQSDLTINDTSTALSITPTAESGSIITVVLNTSASPVANGTVVPYTISGQYITAALIGQPLTGNFVVNNNTAQFTITIGATVSTTLLITSLGTTASCSIVFTPTITDEVVESQYIATELAASAFTVLPFSGVEISFTALSVPAIELGAVQINTANYVNYAVIPLTTMTTKNGNIDTFIIRPLGQELIQEYWI